MGSRLVDSQQPNLVTENIIGAAIEVHRTLGGPGLLESIYEEALCWEMSQRSIIVTRQTLVPINYQGQSMG
ncbi:MAG: GxxExxY protein, partial [Anaerolineales bacterium]|nr:GxxExxY protein [Anaerolineales bacterium]